MEKYYIYKYYINDELIYIGRTNNILSRHKAHLQKSDPHQIDFQKATDIYVAEFSSDADMMIYEKYYITKYHPRCNTVDMKWSMPTIELPEPIWHIYTPNELEIVYSDKPKTKNITKLEIINELQDDNQEEENDEENYDISNFTIINISNLSQEKIWDEILQYDLTKTAFILPIYQYPLQFVKDTSCTKNINYIYKNIMYPFLSNKINKMTISNQENSKMSHFPWLKLYHNDKKGFMSIALDGIVIMSINDNNEYEYTIRSEQIITHLYNKLFNIKNIDNEIKRQQELIKKYDLPNDYFEWDEFTQTDYYYNKFNDYEEEEND